MFRLACHWKFIDKNPATGISKHQENNERQRYLSDQELISFIEALKTEVNKTAAAAFELLLDTGVRRQEALDAKWEDVDLVKRTWFIPLCKSGKSRHVILNARAVDLLKRQPRIPGNPYLFPGKVEGKQINNAQKAFARVLKTAGITGV